MSRITRIVLSSAVAIAIGASVAAVPAHAAPTNSPARPTAQTTYTVKPGDFLYGIAVKLKVRFNDLLAVNGLTKQSVIHPGDLLIVPTGGVVPGTPSTPPSTPAASDTIYTVKPGDYFKRIATALGVSMNDLLAVNRMKTTSVIHPGMKLKVPVGGVVPAVASGTPAKVTTVIDFAMAQLGEAYRFLGAGPDIWDCSGLTMSAYAAVGISLPHQSAAQAKKGQAVDWVTQGVRAGDLVFLATNGVIGHVGIATSATTWIQSPGTGDVVRTGNIPFHRVFAVRRLVNGG